MILQGVGCGLYVDREEKEWGDKTDELSIKSALQGALPIPFPPSECIEGLDALCGNREGMG